MQAAAESLTAADGNFPDEVRVELVGSVVVGDCPQLSGRPGIDDLARKTKSLKFIDALCVGTDVDRLRISVVQIEVEPVALVTQHQLQSVVGRVADAAPGVQD